MAVLFGEVEDDGDLGIEGTQAKGVEVKLEKIEDLKQIMSYGVMSTPGVVIEGKVVHAGGVPARTKIESWL